MGSCLARHTSSISCSSPLCSGKWHSDDCPPPHLRACSPPPPPSVRRWEGRLQSNRFWKGSRNQWMHPPPSPITLLVWCPKPEGSIFSLVKWAATAFSFARQCSCSAKPKRSICSLVKVNRYRLLALHCSVMVRKHLGSGWQYIVPVVDLCWDNVHNDGSSFSRIGDITAVLSAGAHGAPELLW